MRAAEARESTCFDQHGLRGKSHHVILIIERIDTFIDLVIRLADRDMHQYQPPHKNDSMLTIPLQKRSQTPYPFHAKQVKNIFKCVHIEKAISAALSFRGEIRLQSFLHGGIDFLDFFACA